MRSQLIVLALVAAMAFCADPPVFFDARDKWPNCIMPIRDQKTCISTWAQAFAGMMSDRYCIQKSQKVPLSAQDLLACTKATDQCNGLFNYADINNIITNNGTATEACIAYKSADAQTCQPKCDDGTTDPVRVKCSAIANYTTDTDIKNAIMNTGPVFCYFTETIDHKDYYDGIYYYANNKKKDAPLGVKIIGWGRENGIDYWIGELSLSSSFGENGYVRYKAKDGFCKFASSCDPQ